VLDTWFSSGLWPFSTLGWPDDTEDFRTFYPTTLLITGFDILFFWVSRMIMLGLECTGDVPFREVHMHGLVRDAERQKMSKTKGNVVDPLEIMDRFGTDACRVGLLISAASGADIALKEDRLVAGRSFANKIWNASRLLFLNMEASRVAGWTPPSSDAVHSPASIEDIWILDRLNQTIESVTRALEFHRYHEVAQGLWNFVWGEFCDWYLEVKKLRFQDSSGLDSHWQTALAVYESTLRLLHPLMPFITEELWQRLVQGTSAGEKQPKSISLAAFPVQLKFAPSSEAIASFTALQEIVIASRELRADNKLDPKATLEAALYLRISAFDEDDLRVICSISKLAIQQHSGSLSSQTGIVRSTPTFDLHIHAAPVMQNGRHGADGKARILKEIAGLEKAIESSSRQLDDPGFTSKAPPRVVEAMRAKLAEYRSQLEKNFKLLEGFE
jgi:valyl-tRNA synthetase